MSNNQRPPKGLNPFQFGLWSMIKGCASESGDFEGRDLRHARIVLKSGVVVKGFLACVYDDGGLTLERKKSTGKGSIYLDLREVAVLEW